MGSTPAGSRSVNRMNPGQYSEAFRWPRPDPDVENALRECYQSGAWGQYEGPAQSELAERLADLVNRPRIRLCSSGTIGVEIALSAVGVRSGDEVILGGYDFPGNFRSIERLGAVPVLADLEPDSWRLDPRSVLECVTEKTRAVIVSHLHGDRVRVKGLVDRLRAQGVAVVEDLCQCPGATGEGQTLGSFGDVTVLSFGGSKLLTAGRGGAIATDNALIEQRATIHCERGNNAYPMSELQAAALIPQIAKLSELRRIRNERFSGFRERLDALGGIVTVDAGRATAEFFEQPMVEGEPDFFKVPILLPDWSEPTVEIRQSIVNELRNQGILIDKGFKGFAGRSSKRCRQPVGLDHAVAAARRTLVLHHPCLLSEQFESIAEEIMSVLRLALERHPLSA